MSQQYGPLVVVENDKDDQEIFQDTVKDLGYKNPIIFFDHTADAYQYLLDTTDTPLLILSDINLPGEGGVDFKRRIDGNPFLRQKSIPFIFFSTFIDRRAVETAYKELTVQGFFRKSSQYEEYRSIVKMMIDYWKVCQHPNSMTH